MNYKWTFLNIIALLFCGGIFLWTSFNYKQLSEGEGWGIVGMIGLLGVGFVALVVDLVLQACFNKRKD